MKSLVICTHAEYCAGGKIEKKDLGRACGSYGGGARGVQGSGGDSRGK